VVEIETQERMFEGIAQSLVREREARGISQKQLARKAGISLVQMQKLEDGRHSHPSAVLQKVASALKIDVQVLVS